ncbi:MAG: hypothetical protein WDZ59_05560 [Pirellulales bacterium]
MINKQLLDILVCPETHARLTVADESLVASLNAAIRAGRLTNRGGEKLEAVLDAALVRDEGDLAYPVIDGIPVMLIEEAIPLVQLDEVP